MSQLFEDGKVVNVDGTDLECTGVSYQEVDGVKSNFVYQFREKSELDAEREEAARLEEERKKAAEEAESQEEQ